MDHPSPRSVARVKAQIRWLQISIAATLIAGATAGIAGSAAAIATPDVGWGVVGYLWLSAVICLVGICELIRDLRHLRHIRQSMRGSEPIEAAHQHARDLTQNRRK